MMVYLEVQVKKVALVAMASLDDQVKKVLEVHLDHQAKLLSEHQASLVRWEIQVNLVFPVTKVLKLPALQLLPQEILDEKVKKVNKVTQVCEDHQVTEVPEVLMDKEVPKVQLVHKAHKVLPVKKVQMENEADKVELVLPVPLATQEALDDEDHPVFKEFQDSTVSQVLTEHQAELSKADKACQVKMADQATKVYQVMMEPLADQENQVLLEAQVNKVQLVWKVFEAITVLPVNQAHQAKALPDDLVQTAHKVLKVKMVFPVKMAEKVLKVEKVKKPIDLKVKLVFPVQMANEEKKVMLEKLDEKDDQVLEVQEVKQEIKVFLARTVFPEKMAPQVIWVQKVYEDSKVNKESQVMKVPKVFQAQTESKVLKVCRVHQDKMLMLALFIFMLNPSKVKTVYKAKKVHEVWKENLVTKEILAHKENEVLPDHPDLQVKLDLKVTSVCEENEDLKDQPAHKDHQAAPVHKVWPVLEETRVLMDQQDLKVRKVIKDLPHSKKVLSGQLESQVTKVYQELTAKKVLEVFQDNKAQKVFEEKMVKLAA